VRRLPVLVAAGLVAAATAATQGPLPAAATPTAPGPAAAGPASAAGSAVEAGSAGSAGSAAAAGSAGAAGPAGAAGGPKLAIGGYDVTLITGDKVRLTVRPDGRQSAAVVPAARDDGRAPSVQTQVRDGRLYVIPDDAAGYLGSRLDRELFDVTGLVAAGYDDRHAGSVPVIVDYRAGTGALPPGMRQTARLASIGALAARVSTVDAPRFGRAMAAQARQDKPSRPSTPDGTTAAGPRPKPQTVPASGLFNGIDKIWLDSRVRVSDEDSAAQVGAPAAWAAGLTGADVPVAVLDTGIDSTHPDLAGKVTGSANFSGAGSDTDHFGHGSHVASIIAGTGAASGGSRRGIGFGAGLLNVKVLDDNGNGTDSGLIAGAEWAAQHGAKVANLSLGSQGFHNDGTDPLSQAINQLTEQYGTLFVVAAGNDGPGDWTITAPGTADRALTVGAVDKQDVLAPFSSRGPRVGDAAIKPDITAPGVGIIAAKAAGSTLGEPVDDVYMSLSGTSMATPHVAGAAAVLLQQHPDWTADEVKAALVGTAAPAAAGYPVFQQGGGRLDLARATAQPVVTETASLSLGFFAYPQAGAQPVTRPISYRNTGSAAVTLALTAGVTDQDGTATAPGALALSANQVTVPAGGSAQVSVTVDPRIGGFGLYGGYITATAPGGVVLRTAVGYYRESLRYNLTVQGIARDGRPAGGISSLDVLNVDDRSRYLASLIGFTDGSVTLRVPPGHYALFGYLFTYDEPSVYALDGAAVHAPEVTVGGDTTVLLDGRRATEIVPKTPDATEPSTITLDYYRSDALGRSYEHSFTLTPPISHAYAAPTGPVRIGRFEFYSQFSLRAPIIRLRTTGPAATDVPALYAVGSPQFDGQRRLPVVYAGLGRTADLAGLDLHGKVALIRRGEITFLEKMRNATAAGAALILIFNHSPGQLFIGGAPDTAPALSMTQAAGEALLALTSQGPVTMDLTGVVVSPYQYDLIFPEPNRMPARFSYPVGPSNVARLDTSYHSDLTPRPAGEVRYSWRPWQSFAFAFLRTMPTPLHRREYVSTGDTRWQHNVYAFSSPEVPFGSGGFEAPTTYRPGQRLTDTWWAQPARPGALPVDLGGTATRTGDTVALTLPPFLDAQGHWAWLDATDRATLALYRDGQLVGSADGGQGSFPVPPGPGTYRIDLDVSRTADWWPLSTSTSTKWTVRSSRPRSGSAVLPLLSLDYGVALDPRNRGRLPGTMLLTVGHIPGGTASRITDTKVWTSADSGTTWTPAPVLRTGHNGQFRVLLPRPHRSDGFVSVKVVATDGNGGKVQQIITRAWAVLT